MRVLIENMQDDGPIEQNEDQIKAGQDSRTKPEVLADSLGHVLQAGPLTNVSTSVF